MTSKRRFFLSLISTVVVFYLAAGPMMTRVSGQGGYSQLSIFHEVFSMVRDSYVDPVNIDRTMSAAERGLLEGLDGDSAYLDDLDFKAYTAGKRGPANPGIVLGRRFGFLTVIASIPGSAARKAGVKSGDFIKAIDGKHTHNLSVFAGERLLDGDPGSIVKVSIFKTGGDTNDVELVRERAGAVAASTARMLDANLGYLVVPEFGAETPARVKDSVRSLVSQGAKSLVVDLRGSARGDLTLGPKIAELFLAQGVITKLASRGAADQVIEAKAGAAAFSGPLAILIDRGTAGAAEIVAGALGERATLVGENTYGRATIQKPFPLPSGGGLVLTVSRYLTASGIPILGKGVAPKVAARNPETLDLFGTPTKDPILDKAIETLKGGAAKTEPAASE